MNIDQYLEERVALGQYHLSTDYHQNSVFCDYGTSISFDEIKSGRDALFKQYPDLDRVDIEFRGKGEYILYASREWTKKEIREKNKALKEWRETEDEREIEELVDQKKEIAQKIKKVEAKMKRKNKKGVKK